MGLLTDLLGDGSATSAVRAKNTSTQSIPNATSTALTFPAEDWDDPSAHDTGTNPSRITVPAAWGGKRVRFRGFVMLAAPGSGSSGSRRILELLHEGTTVKRRVENIVDTNNDVSLFLDFAEVVTAGDYYELQVYQTSGGSLSTRVAYGPTTFEAGVIE